MEKENVMIWNLRWKISVEGRLCCVYFSLISVEVGLND